MSTPEEVMSESDALATIADAARATTGCLVYLAHEGLQTLFKWHRVDAELLGSILDENTNKTLGKFQETSPPFNTAKLSTCVQKVYWYIRTFPEWELWNEDESDDAETILVPTIAETSYHDVLKELLFEAVSLYQEFESHRYILEPEGT